MEEAAKVAGKTVGEWLISNAGNVGWIIIFILFLLSCVFKITKKEIDPLGWVIGKFGKALTKEVRKDVADLKTETNSKFDEIKTDRAAKIDELKSDYDTKIKDLREDLDGFETRTNTSIDEIKKGTSANCEVLKKRLTQMEKSNDMQTVRQIKAHVLDFANSCMNGRKHTKKEFENIIKENEDYENLRKKYKLKNNVYTEDFAFIMKIYHQCQENGSFLQESNAHV